MSVSQFVREVWLVSVFGVLAVVMVVLGAVALADSSQDPTAPQLSPAGMFGAAAVVVAVVTLRTVFALSELLGAYKSRIRGEGCPDWRTYFEYLSNLDSGELEDS